MQVFVKRLDLSLPAPPVIAFYPEAPILPRDMHGTDAAVLSLPHAALSADPVTGAFTLMSDWRTQYVDQVVNDEARRRIIESFAEYMQANALWAVQYCVTHFGADPAEWDAVSQEKLADAEQGWNYIKTVRQTSDAMVSSMPVDPTADGNWPVRIPPVYVSY